MPDLAWQKSSFSGGAQDNCVEVAAARTDLRLRESDEPGTALAPDRESFRALLVHLKQA